MSVFLDLDHDAWVESNELAFAIRDGFPVSPGHTLIIPRRIISDWWQAPPALRLAMFELVDDVKRRLDVEFEPNGFNVGFNDGAAAGQTVDHFHVHVIPRFDSDVPDPRGGVRHVIPGRGNYLDPYASHTPVAPKLITQLDGHLRAELIRCLGREEFDRIDLLVSFVMQSGLDLIKGRLDDALARGAHVRLLTTDYLQVTESTALGFFLDRLDSDGPGRLEARVFSDSSTSFHPKAYIFASSSSTSGVAFVGSSNLSYSGISAGVEWNIETREISTLADRFDQLWTDERSITLTGDWLAAYEQSRAARQLALEEGGVNVADEDAVSIGQSEVEAATPIKPWSVQVEALSALTATRLDGHRSGLVVMATGLGKTWLAAFDSTRPEFRRVLFVAHRDEILKQARDVYRQIRPGGRFTLFTGKERDTSGDVVFASVQSLHRNLAHLDANDFDYIVVDEFHHAAAHSYRKVIAHFQPNFLLGLTATPSRADNADLLALCSDNLVYDCGLVEGVNRQLLSSFRYRAIPDIADYKHIPWRGGRFDVEELTAQIATQERAQQVLDEWSALGGPSRRALGFCCTIAHADFMADFFRRNGVAAVAVHSGGSSSPRTESIDRLEAGPLSVLFTVDLFNEGLDVPSIDLVMMLRPTESGVVFLQQLGRGLRKSENKQVLEIVDLVGNHRGFLLKARLLAELAGYRNLTDREAVDLISGNDDKVEWLTELPEGCSIIIEPEVVDLLQELVGPASASDRLVDLARQWVDDHGGRRPTALELAIVSGRPFSLKQQGGWFGLMRQLGLLSQDEERVVDLATDFLLSIEHGNYTKSYKLITLLSCLQLESLRHGTPTSDLARMSRWMIFRDSDLIADVSDAGSAFVDVSRPTAAEWGSYWRKNPIDAFTKINKRTPTWFSVVDDQFILNLEVPKSLGFTFDAMVEEIATYRLHRYLVGQKARRVGEKRRPFRDGAEIDATFVVETIGGVPTSVVIESAGGSTGDKSARNTEYVAGFDVVLERLGSISAQLADAFIDTRSTANLSIADRRLDPGSDLRYPVDLSAVSDLGNVRRSLLRSMTKVGRDPGAKGGGNARRRTRLVVAIDDNWTAVQLADAIASGNVPVRTRLVDDRDTAG
jgi:superfamily II DNA or RNA helicase/diadenosine tetraphosphate (Ap4A) HIT family hydrolase